MYSKTIATSDVGTTIAMMEEVLNGDGSRSIVAGYGLCNRKDRAIAIVMEYLLVNELLNTSHPP